MDPKLKKLDQWAVIKRTSKVEKLKLQKFCPTTCCYYTYYSTLASQYLSLIPLTSGTAPVSYTHLDVYKRQVRFITAH